MIASGAGRIVATMPPTNASGPPLSTMRSIHSELRRSFLAVSGRRRRAFLRPTRRSTTAATNASVPLFTASVGEGHDLPARPLAAQLREENPDVEVVIEDGLAPMGRAVVAVSESAPRFFFFKFDWLWDVGFWAFVRFAPTRRLTQAALTRVGGSGLLRLIRKNRPDVIVSVYPTTTEVLGRLRRSGRLGVPGCAAITDLSALRYWATPGADVHLVTHPESVGEVREIAGVATRVFCVTGLTDPAFLERRSRLDARAALGLPAEGTIVLVSGGGWGVGRLDTAVEVALGLARVGLVVC